MKLSQRSSEGVIIRQPEYFTKGHFYFIIKTSTQLRLKYLFGRLIYKVIRMILN